MDKSAERGALQLERPVVHVKPQTANSTGIKIVTNSGQVWIVASDNGVIVQSDSLEIQVRP
jgi:hypothetical protein